MTKIKSKIVYSLICILSYFLEKFERKKRLNKLIDKQRIKQNFSIYKDSYKDL